MTAAPISDQPVPASHAGALDAETLAQLEAALAIANIPTLLPVLVQLTGDRRWMDEAHRPKRPRGLANSLDDNDDGGLPPEVQDEIRSAALDAIAAWLVDGRVAIPEPDEALLCELVGVSVVETIPSEYGPFFRTVLGLAPEGDPPCPWRAAEAPSGFRVAVIGAGASGIAMGVELLRAGIDFTILEKAESVGGTWLRNRYPGCGVDSPSHLYSFSFSQYDWPAYFSLRDTLHDYFEFVATDAGLRAHIELNTEVMDARYDAGAQRWTLEVRQPDGTIVHDTVDVVVSAVGAFAISNTPDLPGLADYQGEVCHTANWPDDIDLRGRRVAVIGNGASAMQLVPAIAEAVEHLVVIQRTPQWVAPFPKFHAPVPDPVRWLIANVPLYLQWYRLRLNWIFNDRTHTTLQRDPDWAHLDRSMNVKNERQREFFREYIIEQLGDRQDLLPVLEPSYPPFGKRMLFDNGWYTTLIRPDVSLNTSGAVGLGEHSVIAADGKEYDVDVVVFATGFDVVRFLSSIDVHGRSGRSIRDAWDDDDAQAYLGVTVPDFPNLFLLYGPNVQSGHGGSLLAKIEAQTRYIVELLQYMFANDLGAVECREDVFAVYNAEIQRAHEQMVWTHPGVRSYYQNSRGRAVVNLPLRNIEYYSRVRHPAIDDFDFEPRRAVADAESGGA